MFNIKNNLTIEENYQSGLLPQRNQSNQFYQETSCRSNLNLYQLSSENKRILKKIENYQSNIVDLNAFSYDIKIQKTIFQWIKKLGWKFPVSSLKTIFKNHIFNRIYIWTDKTSHQVVAYSICYFSSKISHIGYVFYQPELKNSDFPIGIVLQFIIDSKNQNLDYAYLGRFDPDTKVGFYKRNMPGFEYYQDNSWVNYHQHQH